MRTRRLVKRSFSASGLLHFAAISALAGWSAYSDLARPRFAGQNTSIELIVARANTTWTPEPITFDLEIVDDVRVTVEPKSVQIARKQFDDLPATETAFKGLATESLRRQHSTALDLAHTRPSNNAESIAEGRPPKTFDLPRPRAATTRYDSRSHPDSRGRWDR